MPTVASVVLAFASLAAPSAAKWRLECGEPGNGQFNMLDDVPTLSTICPGPHGLVCTTLDLSLCYMNKNGHLVPVINGGFERSCRDCHLTGTNHTIFACDCRKFGKNAPWQYTEVDTEKLIVPIDGLLSCWGEIVGIEIDEASYHGRTDKPVGTRGFSRRN
ncbi:Cyanovirin-N [Xylariomycetidae sp. FL0641]|nr:Cyanovirin-N [Xylariomycetidae sp. FL0641]